MQLGGPGDVRVLAVAAGEDSHCVGGGFSGRLEAGGERLDAVGQEDAFLICLEEDGSVGWSRRWGAPGHETHVRALDFTAGDLIAAGQFAGEVDLGELTLTSEAPRGFVARLRGDGTAVSVLEVGEAGEANVLAVDALAEQVVIAGWFDGQLTEDLTTSGMRDGFAAALSSEPELLYEWAATFGGAGDDVATDVAQDGTSIVLAGSGTDPISLPDGREIGHGNQDGLILSLSESGDLIWANALGGPWEDRAHGVVFDGSLRPSVSGTFETDAEFGDGLRQSADSASALFVARYERSDGDLLSVAKSQGRGEVAPWSLCAAGPEDLFVAGTVGEHAELGEENVLADAAGDGFVALESPGSPLEPLLTLEGERSQVLSAIDCSASTLLIGGIYEGAATLPGLADLPEPSGRDGFLLRAPRP